jgi:hypothetical protein
MPGVGRHPYKIAQRLSIQHDLVLQFQRFDQRKFAAERGGDPVALIRLHPDQRESCAQLGEMARGRDHHDQEAARRDNPAELARIARGEYIQQQVG